MKRIWVAVLACGALQGLAGAHAAQGDWLGRARVINVNPDASSSALSIDVNSKTTLELDFSYFVTNHLALELILATKKHQVTSNGAPIGSVTHLPPTLTLQYHFLPDQQWRPYVGIGLNYTRFYDVDLLGGAATVGRSSWGPALNAGMDIAIDRRFFVNLDVKKIWMDTDVKTAAGAPLANLKINPLIIGVGIGMKF